MKKLLILVAVIFIFAQTAWAEIGSSLHGFMESDYARKNHLYFSRTHQIGSGAPTDMAKYIGYYEHTFAQKIGRTNFDYGLILVTERAGGANIVAQKLSFETPRNWQDAEVIYPFVIDHIKEATAGKVAYTKEKFHMMMKESRIGGGYLDRRSGFLIAVNTLKYREHLDPDRQEMVYLTEILIRR